jgi:hypothetical protein
LLTNDIGRYPRLQFPDEKPRCLQGQHRIKVGREVLSPRDRWWTVDLYLNDRGSYFAIQYAIFTNYSKDISDELKVTLKEEYSNEKQPSDGEIYCKIWQYREQGNTRFEKRWWSRLSSNSKADRLRQLLHHDELSAAFSTLLPPIPGIRGGMRISMLGKVIALKYDEVSSLYNLPQLQSILTQVGNSKLPNIREGVLVCLGEPR